MPSARSAGPAQLLRDIPDHMLVPIGEMTIIQGSTGLVGKGANGEVRHALWNGTTYAVKDLKHLYRDDLSTRDRAELHSDFAREASLLARCRHQNVLMLAGIVPDSSGLPLYMMTELHQTNLHSVIQQHSTTGTTMPLSMTLNLAIELIRGVVYLHRSRSILHRDIKPSNLLCNTAGDALSIADFGEAQLITADGDGQDSWYVAGTPAYMAPEALRGEAVDTKSDIFSVGVTLLEMCTGEMPTPTPARAVGAHGRRVVVSEMERRQHELGSMSHGAFMRDLVRSCLADSRSARPSASQLLQEVLAMRDDGLSLSAAAEESPVFAVNPAHDAANDTIVKLQMQVLELQQHVREKTSRRESSVVGQSTTRLRRRVSAPFFSSMDHESQLEPPESAVQIAFDVSLVDSVRRRTQASLLAGAAAGGQGLHDSKSTVTEARQLSRTLARHASSLSAQQRQLLGSSSAGVGPLLNSVLSAKDDLTLCLEQLESSTAPSPDSTGSFKTTAFGTVPVPEGGRFSDVDVFGDWQEKPVSAPATSVGEVHTSFPKLVF